MSWLEVSGVSLQEHSTPALLNISFGQPQFQKLAIAGETGAGKSTLLQIIAGLVQSTAGEVRFEGRRVKGPQEVLVPGHAGIAYLSQHSDLPPSLRVEQVLRYANKLPAGQAGSLYEVCRISHLAGRRTNQLSGGEKQRVALTRLLLASPKLLLLDEPFSNLDRVHKQILKSVIHDLGTQLGITCILVSHDPADILSWADQLLVLNQGRLVQQGTPQQVYRQPADEYTAALFGDYNLLTGPAVAAFSKLAGVRKQGARMLVRPENFRLAATGGAAGQVAAVRFFGSYSEVDVDVLKSRVLVKTSQTELAPGAAVAVALSPTDVWYLP